VTTGETVLDRPTWSAEVINGPTGRHYRHRPASVAQLLGDLARWGNRDCLVQGQRRITYAEHVVDIDTVAAHLVQAGVRPGDPVMLLAANSPEWVTMFWAVIRAGGVVVPANAWWSAREVSGALDLIRPRLVFADDRRAALVSGAEMLRAGEVLALVSRPARPRVPPAPLPDVAEEDPAMVLFTSGTMGAAKGVQLSHRAIVANLQNILVRTRRLPTDLPDEHQGAVSLMGLPLFHIGGLQTLMSGQLTGGRLLFLDGAFDADRVLSMIESERVRFFGGVPTMVARLLDCPRLADYDTSSLVTVAMGGSLVVPELAERIRRGFPSARASITSIYGQTEAGGALTAAGGTDLLDRPGCVGRPMPVTELRLHDPDRDGVGEVLARAPTLMSALISADRDDAMSPVDSEGWLHTGDLGRVDDDGYLYIVGRSREIIIRGGENIAPGHVENALLRHPGVADVAVVGLPHPELGEEVAAAVVVRPGSTVSADDLRAHVTEHLAKFEVPSRWHVTERPLPLNAAGKVAKRDLIRTWADNPN
jgi:long-chain acyl-CoA synthetase